MQAHFDPGAMIIDNARLNSACEAYFLWKDLNTYVKSVNTRGINKEIKTEGKYPPVF